MDCIVVKELNNTFMEEDRLREILRHKKEAPPSTGDYVRVSRNVGKTRQGLPA